MGMLVGGILFKANHPVPRMKVEIGVCTRKE